MKVVINGVVRIKHVLTDHGRFFYLSNGSRVYCQKLRNGLLIPLGGES